MAEYPSDSESVVLQASGFTFPSTGGENTVRIALTIKRRLLQEPCHPAKTESASAASSRVSRKHCSALACFPVSTKASKYRGPESAMKKPQKSEHVAYPAIDSPGCIGRSRFILNFDQTKARSRAHPSLQSCLLWQPRMDSAELCSEIVLT